MQAPTKAHVASELQVHLEQQIRQVGDAELLSIEQLAHHRTLRCDAARRVGPALDGRVEVARAAPVGQDAEDQTERVGGVGGVELVFDLGGGSEQVREGRELANSWACAARMGGG